VTNFARMAARPGLHRLVPILAAALTACGILASIAASPAGAIVTEVEGKQLGIQPRTEDLFAGAVSETPSGQLTSRKSEVESFDNVGGNVVLHGTSVYGIYWDPGSASHLPSYHHEWLTKINTFLKQLGAGREELDTIFSALGQYRDTTNTGAVYETHFKGTYSDTAKFPTSGNCTDPNSLVEGAETCLTDAQLREQLSSFIASHGLPKGMNTIYYLLTPPGVTVCLEQASERCSDFSLTKAELEAKERASASYTKSFCSYHGDINPDNAAAGDGNTVLYAAIPWTAGYNGFPSGFLPPTPEAEPYAYVTAADCQGGGWHPHERTEVREEAKEPTTEEEEILEGKAGTKSQREALENARRLEGPRVQEPNQEPEGGAGEIGDYAPGLSDLIINQIAVEQANIVTDPLLTSWKDPEGFEVTDECRDDFGNTVGDGVEGEPNAEAKTEAGTLSNETVGRNPEEEARNGVPATGEEEEENPWGRYYINNAWSAGGEHCVGGVGMVPRFTSPNPVNAGEIVGVNGMESTVGLLEGVGFNSLGQESPTYATFAWNFGDGTPEVKGYAPGAPVCEAPWLSPCAASTFHSYTYGGEYTITLTVTDVAGNVGRIEHTILVDGPPPPTSPSASGSSGAGQTASAAAPGTSATAGPQPHAAPPAPVAHASILSRSLRSVASKGLLVAYSVNEQVAGHFEVLIPASVAHKLKIAGTPAVGLPAGTPPEVIVAKAVLVTTKAGHAQMSIRLSKRDAAALHKAQHLAVTLRLSVHNAAQVALGATSVSSASLGR
jgi:hypothetical protein